MGESFGMRERALRELEGREAEQPEREAAQAERHRRVLLTLLVHRLRDQLDIDAAGLEPEWMAGELGEEPQLTIDDVRFRVLRDGADSWLVAVAEPVACGLGHLIWRHLYPDDSTSAWIQLGVLLSEATAAVARAECAAAKGQAAPEPTTRERFVEVLLQLVREEVCGDA